MQTRQTLMRSSLAGLLALVAASCGAPADVSRVAPPLSDPVRPLTATVASTAGTAGSTPSPRPARLSAADRRLDEAERMIQQAPEQAGGYQHQAIAWLQKARETGDFSYNQKAEESLARARAIDPANLDSLKLEAMLHLTYHRFAEALEVSRRVVEARPRDWEAYGAMVDALVELGRYEEAINAGQTMVDLRPNTASYSRVSYLRALHGDTAGAIEAMRMAVSAADPTDREGLAWCLVHLAQELNNAGDRASAEQTLNQALAAFPDYHLALAGKGQQRVIGGDLEAAIGFYQRAQALSPAPDTAIALADLYARTGKTAEAERLYQTIELSEQVGAQAPADRRLDAERLSLAEVAGKVTAKDLTYSRQLALFWADHDRRLPDALAFARSERKARADIYTADLLAWTLFKNGRAKEAKASIKEALRLGTRDARIHFHAGMIHAKLGDRAAAKKHLSQALEINPGFDVLQADVARKTLAAL